MAVTRTTHHLPTEIPENKFSRLMFGDTRLGWLWLVVRVYVGWSWLTAGWEKITGGGWVGSTAGNSISGFLSGAVKKSGGAHPAVQGWYATFLKDFALPHAHIFSYMVAYGETLVGVALILGVVTGIAAFFGCFMNMNYLLAGASSSNPVLLALGLFLILAWRIAGWYGADRWILTQLGTPWDPGVVFRHEPRRVA